MRFIVRPDGRNTQKRFDRGLTDDRYADDVRATQRRSRGSGVGGDMAPISGYMETLIHGAALLGAKMVAGVEPNAQIGGMCISGILIWQANRRLAEI